MTDLKKLITMARNREKEWAHEYIEPLCFALEAAMLEIDVLRNAPAMKVQAAELTESFSKLKDEDRTTGIPDHAFALRDECLEPGCGKTLQAHASSVWLQSMARVKVEALRWAHKQYLASNQSWVGSRKIWAEIERLEGKK
jgi:spermidine/putrescine-binding protein